MHAILHGPTDVSLPSALRSAGIDLSDTTPAEILINLATDAEQAIASAEKFADAVPPDQEALVVNILHAYSPADWQGARAASVLWAFTRHAALLWAPRRIRVNAIGLATSPILPTQPPESSGNAAGPAPAALASLADIAATILAMWRLRSMTGQLIRLGAPEAMA
jgi:NAD(P)-dependent dehydrogenase (short-subunit alcohol dehydrogenase family)